MGVLLVVGIISSIILFNLSAKIPWYNLIKVKDYIIYTEIKESIKIFSLIFGLSLISNGIQRIYAGLQTSYITHIASLAGSIVTLIFLFFAEKYNYKIIELIIITFGIPNLMCFILIFKLISKKLIVLSNLKTNTFREFKILIKKGKLFIILQIGIMIGWGLDATIIASKLGAVDVAVYNIIQKIFYIVSQPLCMINAPLWGAYANAKNIRDNQFINQTLKKSLFSTFYLSVIIGFLLLINSQSIIKLYTKETIVIQEILILLYYIWSIIESLGNAFAMFLNGCNLIKEQALTIFVFSILSLPIKLYAITIWGLEGMIISQIIVYIICSLFFYGFIFKIYLKAN